MKTLLYSGLSLLLLGIAAVLVIPGLMDWNQYKGQIVDRVAAELGREFVVSGDISLSIVPKTKFSLNGIHIGNIDGASSPRMAHLKSLDVEVSLIPLLMGSMEIRRVILVEPQLILERLGDGRTNWTFITEGDSDPPPFIEAIFSDISFEEVFISKGSLQYIDPSRDIRQQIENVNIQFSTASLSGPYYLSGELSTAGVEMLTESIVVEVDGQNNVRARGELKANGLIFRFSAESGEEATGLSHWTGEVKVVGDQDIKWPYSKQRWTQVFRLPANHVGDSIQLESKFDLKNGILSLSKANFRVGEIKGSGFVSLKRDQLQGQFDLGHLNLDRIFYSEAGSSVDEFNFSNLLGLEKLLSELAAYPELEASVRIAAETVQYKGDAIRDVLITTNIHDGLVELIEVSGLFPGGSAIRLDGGLNVAGGSPAFTGVVEGKSDNFQGLLNWLSIDTGVVAGDRLRKLSFSANLVGDVTSGSFTNIDLQLDTSSVRGGVAYAISNGRLGLGIGVHVDRLNVDAYFPQQTELGDDNIENVPAVGKTGAHLPSVFSEFDADFDIKLDEILFEGIPVMGVVLDGLWQQNVLDVREIGIRDLSGASLSFAGLVTEIFVDPVIQGSFKFRAEKLGSLTRIIPGLQQAPKFLLSSAEIDVAVRGNSETATIDGILAMMGCQLLVRGTVQDVFLPGELDIISDVEIPSVANFVELLLAANVSVPANFLQVNRPLHLKFGLVGALPSFNLNVGANVAGGQFEASGSIINFLNLPEFDIRGHFSHPNVGEFYEVLAIDAHPTLLAVDRSVEVEMSLQGTDKKYDWESSAQLDGLVVEGFGSFVNGHKEVEIRAGHPNVVDLASIFGVKAMSQLREGPVSLSMLLKMEQAGLQIPELQLNVGSSDIRGRLNIDTMGEISRLVGSMESDNLDIDEIPLLFVDGFDDRVGKADAAQLKGTELDPRPNNVAVDGPVKNVWGGLESEISLNMQKFHAFGQTMDDVDMALRLKGGSLMIDALSSRWHDGVLIANAQWEFGVASDFSVSIELKDADLEKLFQQYAGVNPITGRVNIEAEFYGNGRHSQHIRTSVGGSARVVSVDGGIVKGINLRKFSDQLHNLTDPAGLADLAGTILEGGGTTYSEFGGTFITDKGITRTPDFSLFLDGAKAEVSGTVDLASDVQDLEFNFYLVDHPLLPPLQLSLEGDIQSPDLNLRTEELLAQMLSSLAGKSEVPTDLENIVEEVGDVAGQQGFDGDAVFDEADNLIERLAAPELIQKQPGVSNVPAPESDEEDKFGNLLRDLLSD